MTAKEIVMQMTLEEKASLCSGLNLWNTKGIDRLDVESYMVTDGPHGLRKQMTGGDHLGLAESNPATCFPTACSTACSFDPELMHEIGNALGDECLAEQVSVILGPGVNIKRSPLCGRNFEYFSEDPYLTGKMASAHIKGVQEKGIGTSMKHFAANNQELHRMTSDSVVDERALREIYLTGFEAAVKEAQPWTVMSSYNRLNGTYAGENKWLLSDVLRDEWGFQGIVMSDWGGTNDRVAGVRAGLDLEMPGSKGMNDRKIVDAVNKGSLDEADLDKIVTRMVELAIKAKKNKKEKSVFDTGKHHALARRAAAESCVMLKNEEDILPLNKEKSLAVIGAFAKTPRYQGAGSSKIVPFKIDNAFDSLSELGFDVAYAEGYSLLPKSDADETMITEAVSLAQSRDIALVFAGLPDEYESEGFDRTDMNMPDSHVRLIQAVSEANPNTIVVLMLGSPVVLSWKNDVKGIMAAYLGGQAGGSGLADVLSGTVCPGGKLAESWPVSLDATPCAKWYPGYNKTAEYRESIFVGYRFYDSADAEVAFPFGYGLSYTSFEYSDLQIEEIGHFSYTVSLKVTNTGDVTGAEIVQLYIGKEGSQDKVFRASHELKGFDKVLLEPNESRKVTFEVSQRDFAYYNTAEEAWCVESGKYKIEIGASSRDIRLCTSLDIEGDGKESMLDGLNEKCPSYFSFKVSGLDVNDSEFEALLGRPIPPATRLPGEKYDLNTTLGEIQHTKIGQKVIAQVGQFAEKASAADPNIGNMLKSIILDTTLRSLVAMGGDSFPENMAYGIVDMLNGRYIKGLLKLSKKK